MGKAMKGWCVALFLGTLGASGCSLDSGDPAGNESGRTESGAGEEATNVATEALTAVGQRCTVRGNPPVTTGCNDGDYCRIEASTNSIPPSCWGTCAGTVKPLSKCTGAFNCLCGTPVCVGGEWTCEGDCGGGTTE
jgi:hypothetical protein